METIVKAKWRNRVDTWLAMMNFLRTSGGLGAPFEAMQSCHHELPLFTFDSAGCERFAICKKGSPGLFFAVILCGDKNNYWTLTSSCITHHREAGIQRAWTLDSHRVRF